jgi:excisionase family DNA binding protein
MAIDKLLSVEQLAEILELSPKTIYNKISRKQKFPIRAYRVGGSVRFKAREVQDYIDNLPPIVRNWLLTGMYDGD